MGKLPKILLSILVIVVFIQSSVIYYLYSKPDNTATEEVDKIDEEKISQIETIIKNASLTERQNIDNIEKKSKALEEVEVGGWIPDWDIPNGLDSVKNNVELFSEVSPVWFYPKEDGSLEITEYANDYEFINYVDSNNIILTPTITLFDESILSSILNDSNKMQTHIDSIVAQTVDNNYDGIDLDYESIFLKDKELYFTFLEKLALELAQNNKKLVITVLAEWGNEVVYSSLPQTRMVQDYKRLGELADELRIMGYEYSDNFSTLYGPRAPMEWLEDIIKYTIYEGVPREKIVLGIHTYSYDYTDREQMSTLDYYPVYTPKSDTNTPAAVARFNEGIESIAFDDISFNQEWGEAIGTYSKDGTKHYVVYPNDQSIVMRKQLAADYGIKGVFYWRIGGEGNLQL